jgi:hypothetical protein
MKKFFLLLPLAMLYGCTAMNTYIESDIPFIAELGQKIQQKMVTEFSCENSAIVVMTAKSSAKQVGGNVRERHELNKRCQ